MEDTGFLTLLMNFIGPIMLGALLVYLIYTRRRRSAADKQKTEQATKEVYRKAERQAEEVERRGGIS